MLALMIQTSTLASLHVHHQWTDRLDPGAKAAVETNEA